MPRIALGVTQTMQRPVDEWPPLNRISQAITSDQSPEAPVQTIYTRIGRC